jgi:hypothetical protein
MSAVNVGSRDHDRPRVLAELRAFALATRGSEALPVFGPHATCALLAAFAFQSRSGSGSGSRSGPGSRRVGTDLAGVARWLSQLATDIGKPVGVHLAGETLFFAPAGWSAERLAGYVAARHRELEAAFGKAEHVAMVPSAGGSGGGDATSIRNAPHAGHR